MITTTSRARIGALFCSLLLLAACGGGGGTGEEPPPPPPPPPHAPLDPGHPARAWWFNEYTRDPAVTGTPLRSRSQTTGGMVDDPFDFGPAGFDIGGPSGHADGAVGSTANGATFWVLAESPQGSPQAPDRTGGESYLLQWQRFRKLTDDATFEYVITSALMTIVDQQSEHLGLCQHDDATEALACENTLLGYVQYDVAVYTEKGPESAPQIERSLHSNHAVAALEGWASNWLFLAGGPPWVKGDFDEQLRGDFAQASLAQPLKVSVDLSSIPVGADFTVQVIAVAVARDRRQGETGVHVFFRDPRSDPTTTPAGFNWTGLLPTADPTRAAPAIEPNLSAFCQGQPAAGRLEFVFPETKIQSRVGKSGARVPVKRSHGHHGRVSARVVSTGGTAIPGVDYEPVDTVVTFEDGDVSPREVRIPLVAKTDGVERTIELTLSEPSNCAGRGANFTTTTIAKADLPSAMPRTVGGTVSGLVGSGLVLRNLGIDIQPGNGPFTFALAQFDGSAYNVTVATQPGNPMQICTVSNGSGTVFGANVDNVAVDCVTPLPNGALDPTFGAAGKVSQDAGGALAEAVARQGDGKLVIAGGGQDFTVVRLNDDGSLDAAFGVAGIATVDFSAAVDEAFAVAIQADGKIVVAGSTRTLDGSIHDFALARLNADGSLDATFGNGGRVSTDFGGGADVGRALVIQPEGRIIVGGHARLGTDNDFALARYDADGVLDPTFGSGGKVSTHLIGSSDLGHALALQADGKIVLAGRAAAGSTQSYDFALARYNADGSLDAGFGIGGRVTTNLNGSGDSAQGVLIQPDGKIVLAGDANLGLASGRSNVALARYNADGSVDTGFGVNGQVTTDLSAGADDYGRGVALQGDGKIVVAGNMTSSTAADLAVVRYNADGSLDTAFGTGGAVSVDFHGSRDSGQALLIQPDGRIVVAGHTLNGRSPALAVARLLP